MKFLWILIIISCTTPPSQTEPVQQQQNNEEAMETSSQLKAAIKTRTLSAVVNALGDERLDGNSEVYDHLNCESEDIANFLYEKGARPTKDHIAPFINGGTCGGDAKFFIDHLSPEEVAESSMTINFDDNTNEWETTWDQLGELIIAEKRKGIDLLIKKNQSFCRNNKAQNCEALEHLRSELQSVKQKRIDSLRYHECAAYQEMGAYKERMAMQLEFGKKTGVASPKTYDALLEKSQVLTGRINYLDKIYRKETGTSFHMSQCQ